MLALGSTSIYRLTASGVGQARVRHTLCQLCRKREGISERSRSMLEAALAVPNTAQDRAELPQPEDPVEIGIFGPPHGVQGVLRLFATSESLEERLEQPGLRWVQRQKGRGPKPFVPIVIENYRTATTKGGQHWLVEVEGVDSIEEAEQLRGQVLSMSSKDRPEIEDDDEFYAQELIGMQVLLEGRRIGKVGDVYSGTGSHDLLRVEIDEAAAREELGLANFAMVPFVKDIVPEVDREARNLTITPPVGLLNIQGLLKSQSTPKKKNANKNKQKPAAKAEQTRPVV